MGLPLGVEYERKKQRLQHELRMDYRRYTTQVTVTHCPVYFPFYKLLGFSRPKHHSLPQFTQHYHHSLKRAASITEADLDFCGESLKVLLM